MADSVYVGLTADYLHPGIAKVMKTAAELGPITVGLLTDEAVAARKRVPHLNWSERKLIIEQFRNVERVVPQEDWLYGLNILKYRPSVMVHGDDWKHGDGLELRSDALQALGSYGGRLIEIPHTPGISSTWIAEKVRDMGTTPEIRRRSLRRTLACKPLVRIIEAHSPLAAIIVESLEVENELGRQEFDGFWSSSLADSLVLGKPDIEIVGISTRLETVNKIFEVTQKPLIIDADTGGKPEHLEVHVKSMERLGISAMVIEDKVGLKRNSLLGNDVHQEQSPIIEFQEKISMARAATFSEEFMVIARVESLVLDKGMDDALQRAHEYVAAGAHGVMIHSRKSDPDEIVLFAERFRGNDSSTPLIAVPTTYNEITDFELAQRGFDIVIYANQMIRAAYPAMQQAALTILKNGRSKECDSDIASVSDILKLIPKTIT